MKKLYFTLIAIFFSLSVFAQTMESTKTADWALASSWSGNRIPQGGDNLTIINGHTISVTSKVIITGDPVHLVVNGVLYFAQSGQLELPAGSTILVNSGGDIQVEDSNNNSTKLIIGSNSNSLSGSDLNNVNGPTYLDQSNLSGGGCNDCGPLPVNLLYFTATPQNQSVEINWASSKAWDFSHFELERSVNGTAFEFVATIDGSENSNETISYSYSDRQPLFGTSYYRLKAVDIDGRFEYKEMAAVKFGAETFKVYPNPSSNGFINVDWSYAVDGATATLTDNTGRAVRNISLSGTNNTISTKGLTGGMYVLNIKSAAGSKQTQVIIK